MKRPFQRAWALIFLFIQCPARIRAQNSFQNLDFEQGNANGYANYSEVPIAIALPGWSGQAFIPGLPSYNPPPEAFAVYNFLSLGGNGLGLLDSNWAGNRAYIPVPLQGNYSLVINGGGGNAEVLSQTGLVPVGTSSITIEVATHSDLFTLALGGQNVYLQALATYPTYTLYGGDVSAFAGKMESLAITVLPGNPNSTYIDNLQFLTQPVPEPSTLVLASCNGFALWAAYRRRLWNGN